MLQEQLGVGDAILKNSAQNPEEEREEREHKLFFTFLIFFYFFTWGNPYWRMISISSFP